MRLKQAKWCDPWFPNINILKNYLRILLKCQLLFIRFQWCLRFYIFNKISTNYQWYWLDHFEWWQGCNSAGTSEGASSRCTSFPTPPFPFSSLPFLFSFWNYKKNWLCFLGDLMVFCIFKSLPFHSFINFWKKGSDKM